MIELLMKEQQELVINQLTQLVNTYLDKQKHIYVILEPTENDEINNIFLKSGIGYTEPVTLFDDRLEDVGPRISELGKNQDFDRWIIEKAVFNRWTCLFISDVDLDSFTKQIGYLCNAVTFEHKPVIFRMYPPAILNEWLTALQKENQAYRALGICSDIFYAMHFPDQIAHYHFENNEATRQQIDLINNITHKVPLPEEIKTTDILVHEKWLLTENQVNSLGYARAYYLVHELRKKLLPVPFIQENYNPLEVHRQLIRLINLCFQYGIENVFFISEFSKLYFANKKRWESNQEACIKILQSSQPEADKLENIAILLDKKIEMNKVRLIKSKNMGGLFGLLAVMTCYATENTVQPEPDYSETQWRTFYGEKPVDYRPEYWVTYYGSGDNEDCYKPNVVSVVDGKSRIRKEIYKEFIAEEKDDGKNYVIRYPNRFKVGNCMYSSGGGQLYIEERSDDPKLNKGDYTSKTKIYRRTISRGARVAVISLIRDGELESENKSINYINKLNYNIFCHKINWENEFDNINNIKSLICSSASIENKIKKSCHIIHI